MVTDGGGGGGGRAKRRRRVDEQGGQRKEVAAGPEAAPVFRISALPDDLRRRILTHLPLKDAIRSAAIAPGWRHLWKSRWSEPTSCLDIHLLPADKPTEVLRSLESGPRRRLDRFSLVVFNQRLRNHHLRRLLAYAAECRVEDLQIDLRCCNPREKFVSYLPRSSPLLAHLSLRNITISDHYYNKDAQPFCALEVIRLHSVTSNVWFTKVLALCPRLRILVLRRCTCVIFPPPHCLSLRSFRYSGNSVYYPYFLLRGAALADLYICFGEPVPPAVGMEPSRMISPVSQYSPSAAMPSRDGPNCRWDKMSKLPSLKELQLLMHGMETHNLADIYLLLKSCHFSNLERLFVQLLASSDVPLTDLVEEESVELPGDSLVKLGTVKVMKFNWHRFEVQLVSLLLRKATSLQKLLLVSPNVDPLHVPGVQEADLLILKEALSNGCIIVSESDDPTIQPFHPEIEE